MYFSWSHSVLAYLRVALRCEVSYADSPILKTTNFKRRITWWNLFCHECHRICPDFLTLSVALMLTITSWSALYWWYVPRVMMSTRFIAHYCCSINDTLLSITDLWRLNIVYILSMFIIGRGTERNWRRGEKARWREKARRGDKARGRGEEESCREAKVSHSS